MTSSHMYLKNREGEHDFDIPKDWYQHREPGISGLLRVYNEEEWIGPCIESMLPFVDELIITYECTDRTKKIIDSFNSKKIKAYEYPFYIGEVDGTSNPDSVHDRAYYSNWSLSLTKYQIVGKWDADMIMLNKFYKCRDMVLNLNLTRLRGYNIVNLDPLLLSKTEPIFHDEPRFYKINKYMYFVQAADSEKKLYKSVAPKAKIDVLFFDRAGVPKYHRPREWLETPPWFHYYRLWGILTKKDINLKEPMFIHTKFVKKNVKYYIHEPDRENLIFEPGEKLNIYVPECLFKKPEDYLKGR